MNDERIEAAYRMYGDVAAEFLHCYEKKFHRIVRLFCNRHKLRNKEDELYCDYVSFRMPLYLHNWNVLKTESCLQYVCAAIYNNLQKHLQENGKVSGILANSRYKPVYHIVEGVPDGSEYGQFTDAIAELEEEEQQILRLRIVHEHSLTEISRMLDIPRRTLVRQYERLLERLKKDVRN